MRSPCPPASGVARGWFSERASFLDRLDLEVTVLAAGCVLERRLRRQRRLPLILAHDVALLERMRGGRHLRGIGPFQGVDRVQDVTQLIPEADDLVWCDP